MGLVAYNRQEVERFLAQYPVAMDHDEFKLFSDALVELVYNAYEDGVSDGNDH